MRKMLNISNMLIGSPVSGISDIDESHAPRPPGFDVEVLIDIGKWLASHARRRMEDEYRKGDLWCTQELDPS